MLRFGTMKLASVAIVALASGCASAPPPRTTAWYACDASGDASGELASCAFFRGHFLQSVGAHEEAATTATRPIWIDGHRMVISISGNEPSWYWSPGCPYEQFRSIEEAAVCPAHLRTANQP